MNSINRILFQVKICLSFIFVLCLFFLPFTLKASESKSLLLTQDFRPFSYKENNKVAGPAAEIIKKVANAANLDIQLQLFPWRRAVNNAKNGKAQGLFVIGWNKARTEWLNYSYPIFNTEYGFFFKKENKVKFVNIDSLKDKKYTIGVFGPSNTSAKLLKIVKKYPNLKVRVVHDDILVFKQLSIGKSRLDAIYSNRDVGMALMKQKNITNLRYGGMERKLKYYIGFTKKNISQGVFEKFNETYKILYNKGAIKKIIDKYNLELSCIKDNC